MPVVQVTMPTMLATLVGGDRRFDVEAESVDGVLDAVFLRHPELEVHLLDERGRVRPHVSLFVNDRAVTELHGKVADGATFIILQAVSGG